jgi:hypothetical protein
MRRMVWVAVGAVGGILAYRKTQEALADARERGIVLSAQQVGQSAASALGTARAMASGAAAAVDPRERSAGAPPAPGAAAGRVLDQARQGE